MLKDCTTYIRIKKQKKTIQFLRIQAIDFGCFFFKSKTWWCFHSFYFYHYMVWRHFYSLAHVVICFLGGVTSSEEGGDVMPRDAAAVRRLLQAVAVREQRGRHVSHLRPAGIQWRGQRTCGHLEQRQAGRLHYMHTLTYINKNQHNPNAILTKHYISFKSFLETQVTHI